MKTYSRNQSNVNTNPLSVALAVTLLFLFTNTLFAQVTTIAKLDSTQISIVPANDPLLKNPKMKWAPKDYAKDPTVIHFNNKYYMYFSIPPQEKDGGKYGWTTGIAESEDLTNWRYVKNLLPDQECVQKGFCAPCARVFNNKVYLFYQSYGTGALDAICMSVSEDGLNFKANPNNPIFRPHGDWTNGRAIDADVYFFNNKLFIYAATRDPEGKIQKIVVATSDLPLEKLDSLKASDWTQPFDGSILEPILNWETRCIEAPTTIERNGKLYMFYAGGYNNDPQHIGVAVSNDGITWTRLWNVPFITNGPEGQWNMSETGHPGVFCDDDGQTWLFFQGNATHGKDWYLSRVKLDWVPLKDDIVQPVLIQE